ncbi:MAG: SPW repeat protein [Trueperaceae bacterium]|nr:SPW repeat protein [Trueperaceae bacterium]
MKNEQRRSEQDLRAEYVGYASGLNLAFALWLIITPFVFAYDHALATWNGVVVGALVGVFAVVRLQNRFGAPWLSWLNVMLGAWLFVSPFVLGFNTLFVALWNNLLLGFFVAVAGLWSVREARNIRVTERR